VTLVDASVALKWFVAEDGTEAALRIAASGEPLAAPDLILAEVANAAWKSARLGRLTEAQLQAIAVALPGYFEELTANRVLLRRAIEIAAVLDHSVYDCLYLALADHLRSPLVTADRRLAAKVAGSRWESLVKPLQP
jgi:Predicted nucleic acid-binding protein, contains PIN domain